MTKTNQDRHTIPLKHFQHPNNSSGKPKKSVPSAPRRRQRDTPSRLLVFFPVELPTAFLEKLDCEKTLTRFVAFHIDLPTDRLLRANGMSIKPCPNEWVFSALLAYEPVAVWLRRNRIDLATGRHWLLYDYRSRKSFVADPRMARRCLERQTLPRKPKASR